MPDTSSVTGPSDEVIKINEKRGFINSKFSIGKKTSEKLSVVEIKIYNALNLSELPGVLILWKKSKLNKQSDPAILEVWKYTEKYATFLKDILNIQSLDGKGKCLISSVHVGKKLCNAFWNGYLMVYGDGNPDKYLQPFYKDPMIVYHELSHGLIQFNFPLKYIGESGAINEHVADVISVVAHHYLENNLPKEGRWDPGSMIIIKKNMSLRTFDGTKAYNYKELGVDEQVKHSKDFYSGEDDKGGVHINSGILNHVFYLFCMELNEVIWKKPLNIWLGALMGIREDCNFEEFVGRLASSCDKLYSAKELDILIGSFLKVGCS